MKQGTNDYTYILYDADDDNDGRYDDENEDDSDDDDNYDNDDDDDHLANVLE